MSENVIKFPVEKVIRERAKDEIRKLKLAAAKRQAIVIDEICKDVAESLYEVLSELDYASADEQFYKDFTYMMEAFRSMLFRASSIKHPIQTEADKLEVRKKPKDD